MAFILFLHGSYVCPSCLIITLQSAALHHFMCVCLKIVSHKSFPLMHEKCIQVYQQFLIVVTLKLDAFRHHSQLYLLVLVSRHTHRTSLVCWMENWEIAKNIDILYIAFQKQCSQVASFEIFSLSLVNFGLISHEKCLKNAIQIGIWWKVSITASCNRRISKSCGALAFCLYCRSRANFLQAEAHISLEFHLIFYCYILKVAYFI